MPKITFVRRVPQGIWNKEIFTVQAIFLSMYSTEKLTITKTKLSLLQASV
ncbi:MAG: hypothetical protein O4750_06875 [Trichodesmium sp. St18_bin3_1_1]|nr:hypothetical protein [Trichodesmium sp. St18_bin3_1_1]